MERVGYDADSSTHTFRDADGSYWESDEGVELGQLHRVGNQPQHRDGYLESWKTEQRNGFWKYFGPFALLVGVVLLLAIFYLPSGRVARIHCAEGLDRYVVKAGDTCWDLAESNGLTVDEMVRLNPQLDCNSLVPREQICLPDALYEGPGRD